MKRERWVVALTSLGTLMALLDATIVNVALPTMQRDMHLGIGELQWIVNAYTIPLAVFLLTAGKLSDVYGRKRFFVIGIAVFTIGSAICSVTRIAGGSVALLLIGRVVQGCGSAVLLPGSLAIVNETFHADEKKRTAAVGGRAAMVGLGLALGPLVGGLLLTRFDWTSIFLINLPIGIAAVFLTSRFLEESRDPGASKHFDFFGFVSLSVSVLALVLALIFLNSGNGSVTALPIALFVAGGILGAVFIVMELRADDPLYDLTLFCNRSFSGAAVAVFLLSAATLGLLFFLTLYLQNALGFSPLKTGVALIPMTIVVLGLSPVAGRAVPIVGARGLVSCGMLCGAVGVAVLHFVSPESTQPDWYVLVPGFVLVGVALALGNPAIVAVATGTVPHERSGLASGMNSVVRQIGTAFGIALIGTVVTFSYMHGVHALASPRAQKLQHAGMLAGSTLAKPEWVAAFRDGLLFAVLLLALGAIAAFGTVRKSDMLAEKWGR